MITNNSTRPIIRPATEADVPFLAWVLLQAEASGTQVISYQRLFQLADNELQDLVTTLLEEEIAGCDLSYVNYAIAEVDGQPAGACAAWIEAQSHAPCQLIRGQMLAYALGPERLQAAKPRLDILAELNLNRTPGSLQLESFAVRPEYRGRQISTQLIHHHLQHYQAAHPALALAEIQLMAENETALHAYLKAGFEVAERRNSAHPDITRLLPGREKILLRRALR
ncbi:MAG: GNAT family N-acetyltransferase [Bacteroidetes bacterium]|nr:GNAT family N-acetyltransferase [Bacteroidota bacterium]